MQQLRTSVLSPTAARCVQRLLYRSCNAVFWPPVYGSCGPDIPSAVFRLALNVEQPNLPAMDYIYPINFVGHDEWLDSGYELKLAQGDVVTRDGEFLGMWRVVDYDQEDEYSSGRIEFIVDGESTVKFTEDFAALDIRTSRGFALSQLTRTIRLWHEEQPA